jgi:hypothetical protein
MESLGLRKGWKYGGWEKGWKCGGWERDGSVGGEKGKEVWRLDRVHLSGRKLVGEEVLPNETRENMAKALLAMYPTETIVLFAQHPIITRLNRLRIRPYPKAVITPTNQADVPVTSIPRVVGE